MKEVILVAENNSQTEANKRWQEKNKEKARYLSRRSTARNFIKKDATAEDLLELEQLINERISRIGELFSDNQKTD